MPYNIKKKAVTLLSTLVVMILVGCSSGDDLDPDSGVCGSCTEDQICQNGVCVDRIVHPDQFEQVGTQPNLPLGSDWDSGHNFGVSVIKVTDTLKMWYMGGKWGFPFQDSKIGYAYSLDGGNSWVKHPEPVISQSSEPHIGAPCVIYDGQQYHMWYFEGDMLSETYGGSYATSVDGISWTTIGSLNIPPPSGSFKFGQVWSVIKEGNVFRMWFWMNNNRSIFDPGINGDIGYAESTDGYTLDFYDDPSTGAAIDPVLRSEAGIYDNQWAWYPSVIRISNNEYHMYYGANAAINNCPDQHIALATSEDGINWDKQGIVFRGPRSWGRETAIPRVILDGNQLKLWYSGFGCPETPPITGYAIKNLN